MDTLWQDLRYACRVLARTPGFTLATVLALALGIGANTAIFSVVNAVLLHPLPYKDPSRLVWITVALPRQGNLVFDADYFGWRKQSQKLEDLAAYGSWNEFTLRGVGEAERLRGAAVTSSFFHVLGVEPRLGRTFSSEEDRRGGTRAAILSDALWRRRFNADPSIVGRAIALDGNLYNVTGVLPPGFEFLDNSRPDVIVPFALSDQPVSASRPLRFVRIVARLRAGVPIAGVEAELDAITASLHESWGGYAKMLTGAKVQVMRLQDRVVGNVRGSLLVLLGAVAFVLLIACANVANLQLARAVAREKEVAIRGALGASRGRLARQFLSESWLLGLAGGSCGLLIGSWLVGLLRRFGPRDIPHLENAHLDWHVLLFTLGLSLFTGLLFGSAPVFSAFRVPLNESLKESGSRSSSGGARRPQRYLTVFELAVALVLFVGAGLLVRSFVRLLSVPMGIDSRGVLTAQVSLPGGVYAQPEQRRAFFEQLLDRVRALPGVSSASATAVLPLGGYVMASVVGVHGQEPASRDPSEGATADTITPGYFSTLRIPLLAGRDLDSRDAASPANALVVNQAFQRRFFPNEDPVGQQIKVFGAELWTIVGVVGDVKQAGLAAPVEPEVFTPARYDSVSELSLVIRSEGDPKPLASAVRAVVNQLDKDVPLYEVATFDEIVARLVAPQRFNAILLGAFASLAVLLAGVGVYGVMAYAVSQRTHEIGIRMALGASRKNVLGMVLFDGFRLSLVGVALGLGGSLALARVLGSVLTGAAPARTAFGPTSPTPRGLLFGVTPTDPATLVGVTLLLLAVAICACWIPARRATRVEPVVALRNE